MKNNRINLLGANIDNYSMSETVTFINDCIKSNNHIRHVVVNAWKVVCMQDDDDLKESVNKADLINADGQSIIWASKILKKSLKERVTGIDLMIKLVELANKEGYKIFFLGAKESVIKNLIGKYSKKYSDNIIAGYRNGYFNADEEKLIAKEIANSQAQILFVGISSPKKEKFLYSNRETLKRVNFIMGVGGSFDVESGKVKRAPKWMQSLGMEWLFRLIQEPRKMWKRYLIGNPKFLILVLKKLASKTIHNS